MAAKPKAANPKGAPAPASSGGLLAPVENLVMPIAGKIPLSQARTWLSAYFRPIEAFRSAKSDANVGAIVVNIVLIGIIMAVISAISVLLSFNTAVTAGWAVSLVIGIILTPIVLIVMSFAFSAVVFVLAKILGGKGSFTDQTLALVLILGGYTVISALFVALENVPLVGGIFGLVVLIMVLYNIYNEYLVVKGVHGLSSIRAAAVALIPVVAVLLLFAALMAAMVAVLGAGMAGAAATGAVPY